MKTVSKTIAKSSLIPLVVAIICLESVFSDMAGWAVLHQALNARELIGCALIMAAILITTFAGKKKEA